MPSPPHFYHNLKCTRVSRQVLGSWVSTRSHWYALTHSRNNRPVCMCGHVDTGGWLERLRTRETQLNNANDAHHFFRELSKKEDAKVLVLEFDHRLLKVLQDAMRMLR